MAYAPGMTGRPLLTLTLFLLLCPVVARADKVHLRSGRVVEGEVREDGDVLVVRTGAGIEAAEPAGGEVGGGGDVPAGPDEGAGRVLGGDLGGDLGGVGGAARAEARGGALVDVAEGGVGGEEASAQVVPLDLLPSDSTLRFSMRPPLLPLNTPHSCQAKLASLLPNVLLKTMLAAPLLVASVCCG